MIHIRVNMYEDNLTERKLACNGSWADGDKWVADGEVGLHHMVDCPGCKPHAGRLGTPINQLSGQPGTKGYDHFVEIARSWGYD